MGEASPRYFGHLCPESSLRSLESGEMRNASEILQPLTGKLGERGAHFLNHTGSDWRFHCLVEVWRAGGNRPWVKPPRFVQFLLKFGSPVSVSSFSVLPWGNFQRLSMAGFNHFINSSFKRAQVSAAKDVFSSCSNDRSLLFAFAVKVLRFIFFDFLLDLSKMVVQACWL